MVRAFTADAVSPERRDVAGSVTGVLLAGAVAVLGSPLLFTLADRLSTFGMGTARYRTAQWASTAALAALVVVLASVIVLLLARSARQALGVPQRRASLSPGRTALQLAATLPLLACLGVWAAEEMVLRGRPLAPLASLVLGLALCSTYAAGIPRLVANAGAALASRRELRAVGRVSLAAMPGRPGRRDGGLVHLEGVVVAGAQTLLTNEGPAVCIHRLAGAGRRRPVTEAVPFLLDAHGERVLIDPAGAEVVAEIAERPVAVRRHDPTLPIDEIDPTTELVAGALRVGETVHVVGVLSRAGGEAYRDAVRRVSAEGRTLYLFTDGAAVRRRLALAAVVELAAATGLAVSIAALPALWLYLRVLARPLHLPMQ